MINQEIRNSQKNQIIDKLKYVFHDENAEIIEQFNSLSRSYEQSIKSTRSETDETHDVVLEEISQIRSTDLHTIFKKINVLFSILGNLLKFSITSVDDERYQKTTDEHVKFPKTLDKLICVIGCYSEAFTQNIQEDLFRIIDSSMFNDLYAIAQIDHLMIPFVANDKINEESLKRDYLEFSNSVRNIACDMLNINTDFDDEQIIELVSNEINFTQ